MGSIFKTRVKLKKIPLLAIKSCDSIFLSLFHLVNASVMATIFGSLWSRTSPVTILQSVLTTATFIIPVKSNEEELPLSVDDDCSEILERKQEGQEFSISIFLLSQLYM